MRALVSMLMVSVAAAQGTAARSLDSMRDQVRPLLIFAPHASDPRLIEQANVFAAYAPGLRERQVLIFVVTDEALPLAGRDSSVWQPPLADAPESLRRRFSLTAGDFAVILLGKDGGEKLRVDRPISYDSLRETIDSMPMRQQEMQRPR